MPLEGILADISNSNLIKLDTKVHDLLRWRKQYMIPDLVHSSDHTSMSVCVATSGVIWSLLVDAKDGSLIPTPKGYN